MTTATASFPVNRTSSPIMLAVFVGLVSILAGLLVGYGGPMVGVGLAAMLVAVSAFCIPLPWVFWLLTITTFLLAGPIQYFGHVQKIFWLPYLLGLLFLLRALTEHLFRRRRVAALKEKRQRYFGLALSLGMYVLTLFVSSAFNASSPLQILLSLKEYFFLMGAGLAIAWGLLRPGLVDQLLKYSHWFLLVQFPVIVYQHFVIAAERIGPSSWDSVVGLMSGDSTGGGASATMALCVILIMTYHLAAWRAGLCQLPKFLLVLIVGMASIMLAEVKFAILLLPFAFGLIYLKEILRRPLFGLSFLAAVIALGALVLFAYQLQFSGAHSKSSLSVSDYVEEAIERNTGDDQINMTTGEMGRVAAFKFWWANHSADEPLHFLLGHGIGASRIGLVYGEVAQRFRFELGRSSLVTLLWEGGLIAAMAISSLISFGAIAGFRRARQAVDAQQRVMYQSSAIGLFLTLAMLPYGPDFIAVSQAQLIAILLLARIVAGSASATEDQ